MAAEDVFFIVVMTIVGGSDMLSSHTVGWIPVACVVVMRLHPRVLLLLLRPFFRLWSRFYFGVDLVASIEAHRGGVCECCCLYPILLLS